MILVFSREKNEVDDELKKRGGDQRRYAEPDIPLLEDRMPQGFVQPVFHKGTGLTKTEEYVRQRLETIRCFVVV